MCLCTDGVLPLGIKNYQVGIAPNSDSTLSRIQTEKLRWSGGYELHKSVRTKASLRDAAGINQAHPVLNPRAAVGNLGEVVLSEFLLFFVTERTVISRNHLQVVAFQPIPKFLLIPLLPQWRSENVLRALKTRRIHVFQREIQVLRTSFGVNRQTAITGLTNSLQRVITAQMDNVDWRPRHLRER